jgi:hypothetical protein
MESLYQSHLTELRASEQHEAMVVNIVANTAMPRMTSAINPFFWKPFNSVFHPRDSTESRRKHLIVLIQTSKSQVGSDAGMRFSICSLRIHFDSCTTPV